MSEPSPNHGYIPDNEGDFDHAMWWGASYNDDMLLDRFSQGAAKPRYPFAEVKTSQHIRFPPPIQRFPLNDIQMELPQWTRPNYRTMPLDLVMGFTTIPFYATPTIIGVPYVINKAKMVSLRGISYEFDDSLGLFDEFEIEIYDNNELITRFRDMRVKLAAAEPNPAKQFAFGSHLFPVPLLFSVDKGYTISIRVKILGVSPFVKTPVDPYNGPCKILLHAWESQLADRRDGAPRLKAQNKSLDYNQAVDDADKAYKELKEMYPDYDASKVGT